MDGAEVGELNYQHVQGYRENSSLSDGLGAYLSADVGGVGKENKVHDENMGTGNTKADEVQEPVIVAEEIQTNSTSQRRDNTEDAQISEDSATQKGELHVKCQQQTNAVTEGQDKSTVVHEEKHAAVAKGNGTALDHHSTQSKSQKDATSVLGKSGQKSKPSQNSSVSSKGVSKAVARISMDTISKRKNNTRQESQVEGTEITSLAADASLPSSVKQGNARSNYTVPEPFALATNKRASTAMQLDDATVARNAVRGTNGSSIVKKPQLVTKSASAPATPKLFHSESLKLQNQNVKPLKQMESKEADEDAHSVNSSTASTRGSKARPSSASASGFSFRCNERAEKRKEFFSKLEEKIQAKEVEKSHLQAKSKECQEAEIKQLRKSLTFKATPMPSFYHEAAPPKVELKRIPTTRAKSPKLGRQNSRVSESEGNSGRLCRQSHCSLDESKFNGDQQKFRDVENADKAFGKDGAAAKKTMRRSLTRLPSERSTMTKPNERHFGPKPGSSSTSETGSVTGSTENVMVPTHKVVQDSSDGANAEKIMNVSESEGVKEQNEAQSSIEQDGIIEDVENDIPRESESFTDGAKYADVGIQNLQASEASKSKSGGNDVLSYSTAIEQSSSEEAMETKEKADLNATPEEVKLMTPSFSSVKRETGGLPSEITMKDLAPVMSDLTVQF